MKEVEILRHYLEQHFPQTVSEEEKCTCGAGNHARICFFRANGQPLATILPEGAKLTADELRQAIGCIRAERLDAAELDATFTDTELGHMQAFENPFGSTVFCDELLAGNRDLVFCPPMFFGQRGECFRVPTREFLELTHALVLPLTGRQDREPDDWAV